LWISEPRDALVAFEMIGQSVEKRLAQVCNILGERKAAVDDAELRRHSLDVAHAGLRGLCIMTGNERPGYIVLLEPIVMFASRMHVDV
jgi:hypothetical protein